MGYCGHEETLNCIKEQLLFWYEVKVCGMMAPGKDDMKKMITLGRIVARMHWKDSYQADPKQLRFIWKHCGLPQGSKPMTSTGVKMDVDEDDEDGHADGIVLATKDPKTVRACAARANFMAVDCPASSLLSRSAAGRCPSPR